MTTHSRGLRVRRWLAAFAIVLGAAALLAPPARAETKLRFYSWQTDDHSNSVWWHAAIKAFEATHPGVVIDFIKIPRASFADQEMVMFAAGNPPDIVHLAAFEFQAFADQGWLADLGPLIARDGPDLKGWAGQKQCVWKGKTVCINLNYFGFVQYYNAALLKQANMAVPHDWPGFLAAARKITALGHGQAYGVGLDTSSGAGEYMTELFSFVLGAGGRWTDAQGNPTIDTPAVITALGHWKELQRERLTPLGEGAKDIRQLFIEGRIGLRLDGPWMWGLLANAKPALRPELLMAAPPFAVPVGGTSNVIAMPASLEGEKKKLVWAFIRMLTSRHWQEQYVTLTGQLAPRPGSLTAAALHDKPFLALFQKTQDAAATAGVDRLPAGYETDYNQFAKIVTEECQRMVTDNLDPAAVAKRIQRRVLALKREQN